MKIKNLSQQNLNLSLTKSNQEKLIIALKPNQVLYTENSDFINKQLLIYEKKKLIYVNREMDKPDYVNYYKPFFESGTITNSAKPVFDFDEDDDEDILITDISNFDLNESFDDDLDGDGDQPKKGRGRPKGTTKIVENKSEQGEKKGRGRPKGTVKINTESKIEGEKKGRGRPKGSVKQESLNNDETKKLRGRPKSQNNFKNLNVLNSELLKNESNNSETKRGRGRPKGSVKKIMNDICNTSVPKAIVGKRGRPRKNNINN